MFHTDAMYELLMSPRGNGKTHALATFCQKSNYKMVVHDHHFAKTIREQYGIKVIALNSMDEEPSNTPAVFDHKAVYDVVKTFEDRTKDALDKASSYEMKTLSQSSKIRKLEQENLDLKMELLNTLKQRPRRRTRRRRR